MVVPADGLKRLVTETGKTLANDDCDLILSLSMRAKEICVFAISIDDGRL